MMNDFYLNDFLMYLSNEKRYSSHTVESYLRDLRMFFQFMKEEKNEEVDRVSVQSYFSKLYIEGASKKTICRKLSSLKSYGKYLDKYRNINCDFLTNITLPKKETTIPDFLHDDELKKILDLPINNLFEIRNSLIIHVLYSSGLRLSELTSLKKEDYNENENTFRITGKGKKQRIVIFSKRTKELLELYLKNRFDECEYLFINKNGTKLTNRGVELILKNISLKYLGHDKLHPHMLRHTFATKLLNNGMDIRVLQELLGHDSLNATQVYTHIAKGELIRIYKSFHPRVDKEVA